jgi:hypothetical protein
MAVRFDTAGAYEAASGIDDLRFRGDRELCSDGGNSAPVEEQAAVFDLITDNRENVRVLNEQHSCFDLSLPLHFIPVYHDAALHAMRKAAGRKRA